MASQIVDAQCGNCNRPAAEGVQFCAGCGQPLWQKCPDCKSPALLTQKFCNGCGADLHAVLNKQFRGLEAILDRVAEQRAKGKFREAMRLASLLIEPADYRFNDLAARAKNSLAELEQLQQHWEFELPKIESRAARYHAAGRLDDVVKLLVPVPAGVLPEELAALLKNCQSSTSALATCKAELKAAITEKRYDDALACLTQIVEQSPGNTKYVKQLDEFAHRVMQKAEGYGTSGKFAKAVQLLQAIPSSHQHDQYLKLLNHCQEVVFLRLLLAKATFMNPTVTHALRKLEKLTPADALVSSLKEKAIKLRKQGSKGEAYWPEWMKPEKGMLGIAIVPTRLPANFPGSRPECLEKSGSQFWVAIGLALQGITQPMPKGDFLVSKEPSKGILSLLNKKKPKVDAAWGIDIGDASIKAVQMRLTGDPAKPILEHAVIVKYEQQTPSLGKKLYLEAVAEALKKIATDYALKDFPVVINYPGSELIARFIKLPPVAGKKKYDEFVQQDGRANIPMPMEMLLTAYHIPDLSEHEHISPGAIYVAGKTVDIQARKALVEATGLKVTGIQPEPFALWNTLQLLNEIELIRPDSDGKDKEPGKYHAEADMLIDVGHNRTNILISHAHGVWYRTLDWGLASLSNALCSSQQLTFGEADMLRRDISRAAFIYQPIEAMRGACGVPKRELERSAYVAREAIGDPRFRRVMLVGGGAGQPFLSSWLNGVEF